MQAKVCPKCRAQNRPTNAACSNCYSSLASVPVTEVEAPPAASAAAPASRPAPRAAAPTQQMRPPQQTAQMGGPQPTQQMGVPVQTQMGPANRPPGMPMPPGAYQMAPPKKSSAGIIALVIFLFLALFGGLGFAVLKSGVLKSEPRPTESPAKVTLAFLEAKKTEDLAKCEPYLSRRSIEMIRNTLSSPQARSAGFTMKDSAEWALFSLPPTAKDMANKQIAATEVKDDKEADERTAIVRVIVDKKQEAAPAAKPLLAPGTEPPPQPVEPEKHISFEDLIDLGPVNMCFVLVAEGGHWKIDLEETNRREEGREKNRAPIKLP